MTYFCYLLTNKIMITLCNYINNISMKINNVQTRKIEGLFMLHQVSILSVCRQIYVYKNTNVASNTRVVKQDMVNLQF